MLLSPTNFSSYLKSKNLICGLSFFDYKEPVQLKADVWLSDGIRRTLRRQLSNAWRQAGGQYRIHKKASGAGLEGWPCDNRKREALLAYRWKWKKSSV